MVSSDTTKRRYAWIGVVLIFVGLIGHILAAQAIGGTHLAFRDHIVGFFAIAVVSGLIIGGLGWRFGKGRYDIVLLIFGAVQALMGLFVYLARFSVHG
ncbi:MAG: hypothetical protein H0U66_06315 [Gemmatimonadaceae bacterium]|nr:hypothetical protein [Gemmatimonadaceae bacterium]